MEKIIYNIAMGRSKKFLSNKYSKDWYAKFKKISNDYYNEMLPKIPKLGKSIFSTNYMFGPIYIAWYKAYRDQGIAPSEIDQNIWMMNERLMGMIPKFLLPSINQSYLGGFRKKAAAHIKRQAMTGLHPYDWQIAYRDVDQNCFEIDIISCGMRKMAKDFDAEGLFPGICRMDYYLGNLLGHGFERTKTLGDGEDCCNCRYFMKGNCEWAPEKGFDERK